MKSLIRVLLINFVLLLSFLLCIEGAAWIGRALLKKARLAFWFTPLVKVMVT